VGSIRVSNAWRHGGEMADFATAIHSRRPMASSGGADTGVNLPQWPQLRKTDVAEDDLPHHSCYWNKVQLRTSTWARPKEITE